MKQSYNVVVVIPGKNAAGDENVIMIWERKKADLAKNRPKDQILVGMPGGKRDENEDGELQSIERAVHAEVVQETGAFVIKGSIEAFATAKTIDRKANKTINTTYVTCKIHPQAELCPDDPDFTVSEAMRVNKGDAINLLLNHPDLVKSEPVIDFLLNNESVTKVNEYVYERGKNNDTHRIFEPENPAKPK